MSQALHYGSGQLMDQYLIIRISATHRSKWCRPLDDWGTRRPAVATNGYGPRPPMATIGVRSALVHSCSTVCPEDGHKMEDPSLYSFTHIPKNGPFLQYDRGRPQRFVPNYVPMEIVAAAAQVQAQHQMAQPAPLAVPLVYPAVLAQQNHTRPPQQANSRAQNAEQPAEAGSQSKPPAEEVLARVGSEDELENGQTRQPPSSPTARVSFPPSPAGQEPSTTRNRMDDLKSKVIDNSKANDKAEVKDKGKEKANDEARNESGEKTKDEAANEEDDEEPIEHDFEDYHMSGREVPFKPIRILSSDQIRRARRAEPPKYGPMTQEETLLEVAAAYRRQRGGSSLASSSRRQGQSSQQTLRLSTGHSVNTATSNAAVAKGLPRAAFTEDKIRKRKLASDRIPMPLSSRITSRSASNVDCLYPPSPASKKASQTPQPKSKEKTAGVTVASAKSGPSSASSASSSEQVSDTKASPLRKEVRYKRPDDTKPCLEAGPGEDVGNLAITKTQTRPKGVGKSAAPPADKPKGTTEASHQDDKSSEAPAKGATDKEA